MDPKHRIVEAQRVKADFERAYRGSIVHCAITQVGLADRRIASKERMQYCLSVEVRSWSDLVALPADYRTMRVFAKVTNRVLPRAT